MTNTVFKRNEIIFLLGAGASVEANIPDSNKMVSAIQDAVSGDDENWNCYSSLYRYIRSSVFYADGLDGIYGDDVPFNIERLVNVLDELRKKERHTLYPFVGAWNPKLLDVAGEEYQNVHGFRNKIVDILRNEWVILPKIEIADYYKGLLKFQNEYENPLRVFSLNYDLCVEVSCGFHNIQRGFSDREWDWRLFDETSDDQMPILLYKLHGSTDWCFTDDGTVTYFDTTSNISNEKIALIFGTSYKLQYVDPFLFLAYEFRRWTLDAARIIVCVGYGFNDDHINGILQQSLRQNRDRKLLAIVGHSDNDTIFNTEQHIAELLKASRNQIIVRKWNAKDFFNEKLDINFLSNLFPAETTLLPELSDANI